MQNPLGRAEWRWLFEHRSGAAVRGREHRRAENRRQAAGIVGFGKVL
jgi:hypothetical protein